MSVVQRDYILRLIEQLGRALARIAGLASSGRYDEALEAIDDAEQELLGDQLRSLTRLDATSASLMLHSHDRALGWAHLLAERARVLTLSGQEERAQTVAQRALALYAAAEHRGATLSEADRSIREHLGLRRP